LNAILNISFKFLVVDASNFLVGSYVIVWTEYVPFCKSVCNVSHNKFILHWEYFVIGAQDVCCRFPNPNPNPDPDPWPFQSKINRLWHSVEDYYNVQVSGHSDQGFLFYRTRPKHQPTKSPTYTHIHHHHKLLPISAPPYYVVFADNKWSSSDI